MEFPFDVAAALGAPEDCDDGEPYVARITEESLHGRWGRALCDVLEVFGKGSAVAQKLRKPVTTGSPQLQGQRIYMSVRGNVVIGFLKVGEKRLFVAPPVAVFHGRDRERSDVRDALQEINPVCALDFYVHESCQGRGNGLRIFSAMLRAEGLEAADLAYDRPSQMLYAFLRNNFGLVDFRPQNNNYVVFDEYFLRQGGGARGGRATGRGTAHCGGCSVPSQPQHLDWSRPPQPEAAYDRTRAPELHERSRPPAMPAPQPRCAPWDAQPRCGPQRSRAPASPYGGLGDIGYGAPGDVFGGGRLQSQAAGTPAGMPSRGGTSRSSSVPSGDRRGAPPSRSSSSSALRGASPDVLAAGCPSSGMSRQGAGGGAQQRYASPLSHAGHRLMGQSPIC